MNNVFPQIDKELYFTLLLHVEATFKTNLEEGIGMEPLENNASGAVNDRTLGVLRLDGF